MRPTVDLPHTSEKYNLVESFSVDEMNQFLLRELGMTPKLGQPAKKPGPKRCLSLLLLALVGGVLS